MNEISRHLVKLLLDHNCVIIPELGGFIAQYLPAEYNADDFTYSPPQRVISFNQELTLNDGLLIQSLMQTYDSTFPETIKMLEDAVIDMKEELYDKGELDLVGIGILRLNLEGNYEFEPHQHGIASPQTYGLTHFSIKHIDKEDISSDNQSDKYTFSISKRVVNYAAAAVVSAFFFFGWSAPIQQSNENIAPQQAQVLGSGFNWGHSDNEISATIVKDLSKTESPAQTNAPTTAPAPSKKVEEGTQPETPQIRENGAFTIIVSCGLPQKYAERLISNLQKDNLTEAKAEPNGKYYDVVYGNFANRSEAEAFLKQVKENRRFKHAKVRANNE